MSELGQVVNALPKLEQEISFIFAHQKLIELIPSMDQLHIILDSLAPENRANFALRWFEMHKPNLSRPCLYSCCADIPPVIAWSLLKSFRY